MEKRGETDYFTDSLICFSLVEDHFREHFTTWLGIDVAVKMLNEDVITDEDKMWVDLSV